MPVLYRLRQENRNISKSKKSPVTSQGGWNAVTLTRNIIGLFYQFFSKSVPFLAFFQNK